MAKGGGMEGEAMPPALYGPEDAELLLVAWGSTYGPCREAVDLLAGGGVSVAMAHFAQVWPIAVECVRAALAPERRARVICVEGNATGQLASLLREQGVLADCELMLRYDGLPFTAEEISMRATG